MSRSTQPINIQCTISSEMYYLHSMVKQPYLKIGRLLNEKIWFKVAKGVIITCKTRKKSKPKL